MNQQDKEELKKLKVGLVMSQDQLMQWLEDNIGILIAIHDDTSTEEFATMDPVEAVKTAACQVVLSQLLQARIERGDFK